MARDHLQPQFGHFISRVLTVGHAARRTMGIVPVLDGVVVGEFERDGRAGRKEFRARVTEDALPVEVPLLDVDEPLARPVWQRRVALDLLREKVSVGLNRIEVGVDVQRERVGHHVSALARRNIHVLPGHPDERRLKPRRRGAEVETEPGPNRLCSSGRPEVHHEDQVSAGRKWPRHARRCHIRGEARQPAEEVSVRTHRRVRDQPFVTGLGVLLIEPPRRTRGVELHRGVTHGSRAGRNSHARM